MTLGLNDQILLMLKLDLMFCLDNE